jgi:hypothetical protein
LIGISLFLSISIKDIFRNPWKKLLYFYLTILYL